MFFDIKKAIVVASDYINNWENSLGRENYTLKRVLILVTVPAALLEEKGDREIWVPFIRDCSIETRFTRFFQSRGKPEVFWRLCSLQNQEIRLFAKGAEVCFTRLWMKIHLHTVFVWKLGCKIRKTCFKRFAKTNLQLQTDPYFINFISLAKLRIKTNSVNQLIPQSLNYELRVN
mgnify:CR=1 FL=1